MRHGSRLSTTRGKTITVERGQLCAGREWLAKEWGWSPSAVERFLSRLETEQMIEREAGQRKTVITICNYGKYQDAPGETGQSSEQKAEQKPDRNRTDKEK
jgi:DNA-binding GntR family transcriptional regulator